MFHEELINKLQINVNQMMNFFLAKLECFFMKMEIYAMGSKKTEEIKF
jgi:hypothetical protein